MGKLVNPSAAVSGETSRAEAAEALLAPLASPVFTGVVTNPGSSSAGGATASTPSFSSGVAAQLGQTTKDAMVYFAATASGTAVTLAIGPTSTPANTLMSSQPVSAGQIITVRLPAAWYVKLTWTSATWTFTAITC
jgi:hypothetical protein